MNAQTKKLADMSETELRAAAGNSIQRIARVFAEQIGTDDSWRLLLAGALSVMLPELGDMGTVETLRELAANIESGDGAPLLN